MFDARSNAPAISFIRPKRARLYQIALRSFFVFIFTLSTLGSGIYSGESWAAGTSGLASVGSDDAGGPTPLKDVNPETFSLPQELGYIQEAIKAPNSTRTVIHIQDAHCNYAAQKTISEILKYLTAEYGIYAVNCEGGAEGYDLSVFTSIKQEKVREKTADFFVKEGVVNAAEYFAVNNPQKVKLWGVEDPDLYIKNLNIYKDSLSHKEEVDRFIRSISYILNNLKRRIYSEGLLEFDSRYISYKDGKIPFKEYISYLLFAAQKKLINVKGYPDIFLLSQTLTEEDKINFKRANNEKDEVVDKLKRILSKNELNELIEKVGHLKLERVSPSDFYSYLTKKAKSIKLDISGYPELQKYVVYVSLYSAIDRTKISSEVTELEDRIKESLYENDTQRELGVLSKNLILAKNIFNISLTRQDYTYYREHMDAFAVSNYVRFIDKFAPLYKIRATLDKNIQDLDTYRVNMDGFYECSLERDKAFVKNIKFTDHDRPNSIIITGGFHTESLRELFGKEGVSYISIMPKFKIEKDYKSPYLKRLTGQRTALETVIDMAIPAVLNLQVVNILSNLARRVDGVERVEKFALAVAIIAAINEGKDFIMKIDAKVPVEGMRRDKEKFVTFTQGKGAEPVDYSIKYAAPSNVPVSAMLTLMDKGLILDLNPSQVQAGITGAMPAQVKVEPSPPLAVVQPATVSEDRPKTALTDLMPKDYSDAVPYMQGVLERLRGNVWTMEIAAAMSEQDKNPTGESARFDEQTLIRMGYDVHVTRYVVGDKWADNLKKVIENNMDMILKGLKKPAPRIVIRHMDDKNKKEIDKIKDFIKERLENNGYSPEEAQSVIDKNVKFVPISIEERISHFNAPLDLFVDMGMMEIDRYLNNDYPGETLPQELVKNFIALLKQSMTNFDEFKTDDIKSILNMIFNADVALKIKPINWEDVTLWRKANQALLQSV